MLTFALSLALGLPNCPTPEASPLSPTLQQAGACEVVIVDASGGGDFTSLQSAIDAAADGAVVLIRPGTYNTAEIRQKGLTLVRDGGPLSIRGLRVVDTQEQQAVVLKGLYMTRPHISGQVHVPALDVERVRGPLRVESCQMIGSNPDFDGCDWTLFGDCAGGDAVRIDTGLDVVLDQCQIRGGKGESALGGAQANRGGDAVRMRGGNLALYGCIMWGGDASDALFTGHGGGNGGNVIFAEDGTVPATVIVAGTTGYAGQGGNGDLCVQTGGDGGNGLLLMGPKARAFERDSLLYGMAAGCGAGPPLPGLRVRTEGGAKYSKWTDEVFAPILKGPRLLREGEAQGLVLIGVPGSLAILAGSTAADFRTLPFLRGVSLLQGGVQSYEVLGTIPASMSLEVPVQGPELPVGVDAQVQFTQAWVRKPGAAPQLSNSWVRVTLDSNF